MKTRLSAVQQMILMALHYLSGRKLRTTLTTLAIVFGVSLIFGFNLLLPSAMESLRNISSAGGKVDLSITSTTSSTFAR